MKARIAIYLAALSALLVGCAGDASITPLTPIGNPYAGTYKSTVELDNLKTGTITLNANAEGHVDGTMVVSAPVAPVEHGRGLSFGFSVGTLNVHGTVDESGHFNLQGTDPSSGDFSMDGDLSLHGTGTINVRAGGVTYSSTITISHGTGFGTFTINNNGGANIISSNFGSSPYVLISTVGEFSTLIILPSITETNRSFTMILNEAAVTGATVNLVGPNAGASTIAYTENEGTKVWFATSGQMKIVSRTADTIEVQLIDAEFTAGDSAENQATGSFVANGTVKKQ
jgi:hypothetical protein